MRQRGAEQRGCGTVAQALMQHYSVVVYQRIPRASLASLWTFFGCQQPIALPAWTRENVVHSD